MLYKTNKKLKTHFEQNFYIAYYLKKNVLILFIYLKNFVFCLFRFHMLYKTDKKLKNIF